MAGTDAYRIPVDYDTRVRVFKDQVIPDRLHLIEEKLAYGGDYDLFVNRTLQDIRNLYHRAEKEFFAVANDPEHSIVRLRAHQFFYAFRKDQLQGLTDIVFCKTSLLVDKYIEAKTEVSEI